MFMYDKNNIKNCEACPYNEGQTWPETVLPCGQFHCWVELHTSSSEDESFDADFGVTDFYFD